MVTTLRVAILLAGGALAASASAQPNAALSFNGNDYVKVVAGPSINFSITSEITVEAWVRRTGGGGSHTVLRRDLSAIPSGEIYLLRVNNVFATTMEVAFYLRVANLSHLAQGLVPASLNTWHHFAGTYDGTAMRVYWDGELVAIQNVTGGIATSLSDLRIGAGDLSDGWVGELDEVRLWSVARTEAQLEAFAASTVVGNEPGLVANWRFDAGTGQSAIDSSPYANHGQLGATALPDANDPLWTTTSAPLGVAVDAISPAFGPSYGSSPVTILGHGFFPGATTVTVGGQAVAATVVNALTILATIPPGPIGTADVSVSAPYGPATLPNGWTWADALHAEGNALSASAGGSVPLFLYAGPAQALRLYLVATSLSGTSPGIPLPGSPLVLPLNPDVWTTIGLLQVNSPTFAEFFGVLNAAGQETATFQLGPGLAPPSAVGLPVSFAYVVLGPGPGGYTVASNAVTQVIGP